MSGRGGTGKRRGRPPKTQTMERPNKFQYHLMKKPKYLMKRGSDSQFSTPTPSRASSPLDSEGSSRRSVVKPSTSKRGRPKGSKTVRGRRRGGGNQGSRPAVTKKLTFESEYHYGSDFGDSSDDNDQDDDLMLTESESDSLDNDNNDVDSDYSISSFSHEGNQKRSNRQPSPDPLWLQQKDYPALELPDSSEDLLIPKQYALKAVSIYEVFRRFRHLIRLSPFRFEDFCAALVSDEQTVLLTEIHIMLLKAQLREDEAQATHFGPLEQKDSINISLYLIDQMTWPEVLRSYLASDHFIDKSILDILTTKDYPYVGIEDKLAVLQFLTDHFLVTASVRDDLLQEGPIHYDDHCRICHRLGDLLCCETCPAVFHLECVDPPLVDVPTEDWQCHLCKAHQVSGVQDCISSQEKQGFLCRQESLGFDRHGRKYWFITRRIFVENEETSEIWYYSTVQQFEQLLSLLDEDDMEFGLCREIADFQEEIIRQMTITETVTNKNKGNKKSYLEVANQNILDKIKKEKEEAAAAAAEASALENGSDDKVNDKKDKDSDVDDKAVDKSDASDANKAEETTATPTPVKNVVSTRLKTGSLTPRNYSTDDLKRKNSMSNKDDDKHGSDSEVRLTRNKLNEITKGTLLFKLGMENTSSSYVNQYSTNVIALNKPQRNEERDKRRHLSHKFSLTTASEFKWIGVLNSTHANVVSMLRQTISSLEQGIAKPYMHPNWPALRKIWVQAISNSSKPEDFANVLVILQACMKAPLFANVWHEQLGHIQLQRITSIEREEKKKSEKREKREQADEEERNRMANNFVKYSLGLKHQVWKQKGEEYRIHGQWGWIWMSYGRRQNKPKQTVYERMKPHQIVTKVKNQGVEKVVSLEPSTYEFLKNNTETNVPSELKNVEIVNVVDSFDGINISGALAARNRLLYPKVAKKSELDDLLRHRIQLKQIEEQKIAVHQANPSTEPQAHVITKSLGNKSSTAEKQLMKIAGIKSVTNSSSGTPAIPNVDMNFVNNLAKSIQVTRIQFAQLNRFGKQSKCYNRDCNVNAQTFSLTQVNVLSCYSPLCLQKTRVKKQLLTLLRKAHTAGNGSKETTAAIMNIVNRKPSILEQKLTEGKQNDSTTDEDLTANDEIDPLRARSVFVNAFSRGSTPNDEIDIKSLLISSVDQTEEQTIKEECTSEAVGENIDSVMPAADEKPAEVKVEDAEKMEVDEELSNQQPIIESTRERGDSVNDVDVITNQDDQRNSAEKDSLSTNSDEISRERRSSRRSVRGRTSTKTTTTTTRTTTKYDDGSEESETSLMTRTRSKDVNFDTNKVSKTITSTSVAGESRYVLHPNRRFAMATTRAMKKEKVFKYEQEIAPDGTERVYSTVSSSGKVYLNKIILDGTNKKIKKQSKLLPAKYPGLCRFLTKKATTSIMVLQRYEALKLARTGGKMITAGFHHLAKNNPAVWPYPCSRPLFKTCWQFRTMNAKTLAAVALQLRILWCCFRWDDMATKPPTSDGKHQVTTETEIMSLEILKHRIVGRFSEKTEYLRRKVVIPLELPKTIRAEVQSIRSGLRKRKRAESPQKTDPQVSEEWVDESTLDLWEIKLFGERQEKNNLLPVTRAATGKLPINRPSISSSVAADNNRTASPAPIKTVNKIVVSHKATPEEIKEKMEEQLRLQRAAHNKKRALEMAKNQASTSKEDTNKPSGDSPKTPLLGQKRIIVKNSDGTTKIIGHQGIQSVHTTPKASGETSSQKVQIIRGSDGKVSVRGLNPGQQLIQMPDGKLHVLTSTTPGQKAGSAILRQSGNPKVITKVINHQQTTSNATPTTQKVLIRQQVQQKTPTMIVKSAMQKVTPQRVLINSAQGGSSTPSQKLPIGAVNSPQKIITSKGQLLAATPQKVAQTSNLQQILTQAPVGQKILINQANTGNKLIVATQQQTVAPQQTIIQTVAQTQPTQQLLVNQPTQKVVQQYVNSTNQQQQIIVGNQRILLNPGQRIITQQQPPQVIQQQIIQSQPQQQQIVIQQQPQQQVLVQQPVAAAAPSPVQPQTQQIIVNNSNLAQQLAQGKLQVANVNGQQVIIKPLGNNQVQIVAHIKTQTDGQSHIVANSVADQPAEPQSPVSQQPVVQQQIQQKMVQTPVKTLPQQQQAVVLTTPTQQSQAVQNSTQISPSIEQSLLQGQPPGTVIKCVTAQVVQTQNGPRIVLHGLQGNDFTSQQMALVQSQVKQQLLKAQESTGKTGVLGPTKIYLAVQPSTTNQQPPPLTPVQVKSELTSPQKQNPLENQASPAKVEEEIVVNGDLEEATEEETPNVPVQSVQEQSVNPTVESVTETPIVAQEVEAEKKIVVEVKKGEEVLKEVDASDNSFIITPDYIQQTIKNALKQDDLTPEIEEKLLNLQRFQEKQMKSDPSQTSIAHNHHEYSSATKHTPRKRPTSRTHEDDDWLVDTPKRRPPRPSTNTDKKMSASAVAIETSVNRIIQSVEKETAIEVKECEEVKPPPKVVTPSPTKSNIRRPALIKRESENKKEQQQLQLRLYRQKEQLKKDILKKRLVLEKELKNEIQQELATELASRTKQEMPAATPAKDEEIKTPTKATASPNKKRSCGASASKEQTDTKPAKTTSTPSASAKASVSVSASARKSTNPVRRKLNKSTPGSSRNKKEKLYCTCQTPYDKTKFYVGCDLCNNWFHGECVNITESESKNISEFICKECQHARDTQELYCLCRKPYDESQFYICCDKCQDWFHGRCVGILQSEADSIDEYICPNCQRNNSVNFANMKEMSNDEYDNLKKLIKQIQVHKSAWPFTEPVDPNEAPDYYELIKDPMDLQKIDTKINNKSYSTLSEFIGDMTKIFDNCRFYNSKESAFYRCAESLEAFFVQKIKNFRENIVDDGARKGSSGRPSLDQCK